MDILVNKIGHALARDKSEFNIFREDNKGEFLPLVNTSKIDDFNLRPYNFGTLNKPFNVVCANPDLVGINKSFPYNPYTAKDDLLNPNPTYYHQIYPLPRIWFLFKAPVDYVGVIGKGQAPDDFNAIIFNGYKNNGVLPDEVRLNSSLPYPFNDSISQFPPASGFAADGNIKPIKFDYPVYRDNVRTGAKSVVSKVLAITVEGEIPDNQLIDINGNVTSSDGEVAWDTFNKMSAIPDSTDTRMYLELSFETPSDAVIGRMVGYIQGTASARFLRADARPESFKPPTNQLQGGLTVSIQVEVYLYYDVPQTYFETRTLNSSNTLDYTEFNNTGVTGVETNYKNFSLIDKGDSYQFNYISKIYGEAWGSKIDDPLYLPNLITMQNIDKETKTINYERHYWVNNNDDLKSSSLFEINSGLWYDDTNLNYYLNRMDVTNYPNLYGATINDSIVIPKKCIPQILESEGNYILDKASGFINRACSFTCGVYIATVDYQAKKVYLTLINGTGYYLLELADKIDFEIDYFGFEFIDDKYCIYVGKINTGIGVTNNTYKLFSLDFFIENNEDKKKKKQYDRKDFKISFIPCQTHCMGKDGIISKV